MIAVTRMDKQVMFLNPDHIISIEETPDTVITLFNGNHYIVLESAAVIVNRLVAFRARVVRRAETRSKKYLNRGHVSLFKRVTIEQKSVCPSEQTAHDRTPFHSRDY